MVCRGANRTGDRRAAQPSHTSSPTCRRLSPDFALFPAGYRDSFRLTGVPHQKARSRPRQSYRPLAADTLGGRVHKESYRTHERGRIRPTTPRNCAEPETTGSLFTNLRSSWKKRRAGSGPCRRESGQSTAAARSPTTFRVRMNAFGFQIQPPLPRWLAPNSVCQWFPSGTARQTPDTGAAFLWSKIQLTRGIFGLAGSGG